MDRKILIVDDEKNIVDIIAFNLKKEGYTVITAADGEEGVQKAMEENPDLILLDIMMPKLDGYEVCKKIREKKNTPIIMLTARAEELDKVPLCARRLPNRHLPVRGILASWISTPIGMRCGRMGESLI